MTFIKNNRLLVHLFVMLQSVMGLTSDRAVASLIMAWSHTYAEMIVK